MNIKVYNLHKNSNNIFPIEKADYKREWMDQYSHHFAYRCLPLKIANEAGWLIRCPIDFSIEYVEDFDPKKSVRVTINDEDSLYRSYITSHFGRGVVTFSLPFIIRTPEPFSIWARGYPNYYKHNISFLEGIVETYWLHSTFTYNIRVIEKNQIVNFKKGEPLCFLTLIDINSLNNSTINYDLIDNDLKLKESYENWNKSRAEFIKLNKDPENWQKDYFKGLKSNNTMVDNHITTIKLCIENNN